MSTTQFKWTKTKVRCQSDGSCIVEMNKNEVLMFCGYVRIKLLKGQLAINGYFIKDTSKHYNLFSSPFEKDACLSIKASTNSSLHLFPFDFGSKMAIKASPKTCDSIFKIIGCHFQPNNAISKEYKPLLIPSSWQRASKYFIESSNLATSSIMVCGQANCGKSTFCRYLINCLLNKFEQIAFFDLDVGQSEFCPEGIVSITIIKHPLFGHTHHHQHESNKNDHFEVWKSHYFGSNNPSNNVQFYLQCVTKLYFDWMNCSDLNNMPIIINSNGWIQGIGANVLKMLICEFMPTHLIEVYNEYNALFCGADMNYLAEIKQMFVSQNKNHNWCDENYTNLSDKGKIETETSSLIGSWWKQLTENDEFAIKDEGKLSKTQKKWSKYLHNLVDLSFDDVNNGNAHCLQWFATMNVAKDKNTKTKQEIALFKAFISSHVHYVQSAVAVECNFKQIEDVYERKEQFMRLRQKRSKNSKRRRLLSMIAYFTQQIFENKPSQYLRECDVYKVPFCDVSILFLEQCLNIGCNEDQSLILHALNGVIVGLASDNLTDESVKEPPFKKRKFERREDDEMEWSLNVIDMKHIENDYRRYGEIECFGLGIIRSINVKKQCFYLITPVPPKQLNKVNLFVRGKTSIPSLLLCDDCVLTPPFYLNSIPPKDKVLRTTG